MELTLQQTQTSSTEHQTRTRLYGVSDFQINHKEDTDNTVTVFWRPSSPLDEVEFQAEVISGGEITQELLTDLLLNETDKQHVIVLNGVNHRLLNETVHELPSNERTHITTIQKGAQESIDTLNIKTV